jgi:hypothetical protein
MRHWYLMAKTKVNCDSEDQGKLCYLNDVVETTSTSEPCGIAPMAERSPSSGSISRKTLNGREAPGDFRHMRIGGWETKGTGVRPGKKPRVANLRTGLYTTIKELGENHDGKGN